MTRSPRPASSGATLRAAVAVIALGACATAPRSAGPARSAAAGAESQGPVAGTPAAAGAPGAGAPASGATVQAPAHHGARVPGGCEAPAAGRANEVGCYLTAVGRLDAPAGPTVFWYLDAFPTRAAAEAARQASGTPPGAQPGTAGAGHRTVVESLGRVWLFTLAGADAPTGAGGERVARAGPIPVTPGRPLTVRYMEAVIPPGMRTVPHRHSGAETWYIVAGGQCVETPSGATRIRAGESATVPAGPPMQLEALGSAVRRALVLVVHDPDKPWMTAAPDWTPTGACR